jgi:hypothetical protein
MSSLFRNPVRQKKQVFFVRCGSPGIRNFTGGLKAQVKSGPDVFADALVPCRHRRRPAFSIFQKSRCHRPDHRRYDGWNTPARRRLIVDRQIRHRIALACGDGGAPCGNGYRFAKGQGKPNSPSRRKPRTNKDSLAFAAAAAGPAFTCDSSRYLNCPSNLIGHDHPNKPANGKRMIRQSVGGLAVRSCAQ